MLLGLNGQRPRFNGGTREWVEVGRGDNYTAWETVKLSGGQDCGRAAQKRNARWFCDIRLDVASLNRLQDGAGAVSHPQFSQNVGHVILDCTLRELQCGRDFAIAVPPCHQS